MKDTETQSGVKQVSQKGIEHFYPAGRILMQGKKKAYLFYQPLYLVE